jgi:hypothetical protein
MKMIPRHLRSPRSLAVRGIGIAIVALVAAAGTVFAVPTEHRRSRRTSVARSSARDGRSERLGRAYVIPRRRRAHELGVALTEAALTSLPNDAAEYVFLLPAQAGATPFKHAAINWAPQGHPPPMIYTVPHFDFHFYTITQAARDAILLGDSALAAKMARQPADVYVPAGYVTGMSAAQMGMHWNDPTAPERHGEPFTATFIYGSYDGAFIFAEPMISKAYLETKPAAVAVPIKLPVQYATTGCHPTSYTVSYDAAQRGIGSRCLALVRR